MTKRPQLFQEAERKKLVDLASKTLWTDEGLEIQQYLRMQRDIPETISKMMGFGYVPKRARRYCLSSLGFDLSGRLIMPLWDSHKKLVAVTSRDMDPDSNLKHWHESFDKTMYLYGLDTAKQAISEQDSAIVVEGQFDVARLRTLGFSNSVAILGSAMSLIQAALLSRYCSHVYLMFDGDAGGEGATSRSMKMFYENHLGSMDMRFFPCELPEGKDPDDMDKKGVDALIEQAQRDARLEI
jgi:DNA primase